MSKAKNRIKAKSMVTGTVVVSRTRKSRLARGSSTRNKIKSLSQTLSTQKSPLTKTDRSASSSISGTRTSSSSSKCFTNDQIIKSNLELSLSIHSDTETVKLPPKSRLSGQQLSMAIALVMGKHKSKVASESHSSDLIQALVTYSGESTFKSNAGTEYFKSYGFKIVDPLKKTNLSKTCLKIKDKNVNCGKNK